MKYRCEECGSEIDEDELAAHKEYRGECHGYDAYETVWGCPWCDGAVEEIEEDEEDEDER